MDTINDTNAGENIKKYSKLLTEIEKVSELIQVLWLEILKDLF